MEGRVNMKIKRKAYLAIMAGATLVATLATGCQSKAEPDTPKEDADVVAEVEAETLDASGEETAATVYLLQCRILCRTVMAVR